jgi:endoglucanase
MMPRLVLLLLSALPLAAADPALRLDRRLAVDQFGYRPDDAKVAVLADPRVGHDAGRRYRPSPVIEVRRWSDQAVVLRISPTPWREGAVDAPSGDAGWWVDFSGLREPGAYCLADPAQGLRSARFRIAADVYRAVLREACRVFYYQRANHEKRSPFADQRWCDAAGHLGAGQDGEARAVWAPDEAKLARDCRGGWYDAGDQNKYLTFLSEPIHSLLSTWRSRPRLWETFDLGIPESGDGVPDLVDEILVGLRFVVRMQDPDGGVFLKVGCRDWNDPSPPSADRRPRFYAPKATSSSIAAAGMLAHAAWALSGLPTLAAERQDFQRRAVLAWDWYQARLGQRDTDADTQAIKSGDADRSLAEQDAEAVVAAIYLYAATGEERFHAWIRTHHQRLQPWQDQRWGMWRNSEGSAITDYALLPGADLALVAAIRAKRISEAATVDIYRGDDATIGLYRASNPIPTWGSNRTLCDLAQTVFDADRLLDEPDRRTVRRRIALDALHHLHGVNPQGLAYLSNGRALGIERGVDRMFHTWFAPPSRWADAATGIGPAPAFLVGGPNPKPGYDIPVAGGNGALVHQQPWQKAWGDKPGAMGIWALTEPAIYYQAAYIELLAEFVEP